MTDSPHKSGLVALMGRPNVGKSTLLNRLVGQKIAAVSSKPQTTRRAIRGVLTRDEGQAVFIDTPGIHKPMHRMNQRMMDQAIAAATDVDLVLFLADCTQRFGQGDDYALSLLSSSHRPALFLLNKIDRLASKSTMLPILDQYAHSGDFLELIPLSARTGENVGLAMEKIFEHLPEGPPLYPEDELTDQTERALAAEILREKLLEEVQDELPYELGVFTERFDESSDPVLISCAVIVERPSQKAIVIGQRGERLKRVGTRARLELEAILGRHLFLEIVVRVRQQWREDDAILREMGLG